MQKRWKKLASFFSEKQRLIWMQRKSVDSTTLISKLFLSNLNKIIAYQTPVNVHLCIARWTFRIMTSFSVKCDQRNMIQTHTILFGMHRLFRWLPHRWNLNGIRSQVCALSKTPEFIRSSRPYDRLFYIIIIVFFFNIFVTMCAFGLVYLASPVSSILH